jgi:sporulation protein YlmC with PRC-barrel domain
MAGRRIDAGLNLLDRQLVDKAGKLAGKVDDLEFDWTNGANGPYVAMILSGPGALGHRIGGRLGRVMQGIHKRMTGRSDARPARISFGVVSKVDNHLDLSVAKGDLDISELKGWIEEKVIARIPGASHAPE